MINNLFWYNIYVGNYKYYGDIIWTNHAMERLDQRGLTQKMAFECYSQPDKQFPGKNAGTTESIKRYGNSTVTVITKKNEKNEVLVLSVWIDPPMYGTEDYKKKKSYDRYQKASWWMKILLDFKEALS